MNVSELTPLIHARGLVKRFDDLVAVDGVDFDVHKEAFGFLGPNGAGKSSTQQLVNVAYLAAMGLVGLAITGRRIGKLLLK